MKKREYININLVEIQSRKKGIYEMIIKRMLDIIVSLLFLVCFSWLLIIIAIVVKFNLGSPVLFVQERPGTLDKKKNVEKTFKMYKFRTMTDARDKNGNLLSDEERMTPFGEWLRSTSLDEIPEFINVLNGTMSLIGPRPQLVRDLVFMSNKQRERHTAKPGISGLAQVNGRNAITWEEKLEWDLKYVEHVSLVEDVKIIFHTIEKALFKREGIVEEGMATAEDLGDYLLRTNKITSDEYRQKLSSVESWKEYR